MPNLVSFAASIAELTPWRKIVYSIIQLLTQLILWPGNRSAWPSENDENEELVFGAVVVVK